MSPVEIEAKITEKRRPATELGGGPQKTLIERVLSLIADVRREEVAGALLMTLLMFLILAAYYELKTAREVFILVDSFFMRAGDVIQAAVVFVGERLAFAVPTLAAVNVLLVGAWLAVAGLLRLSLRRKAEASRTAEL